METLLPKQAPQLPEWDSAAQMYFALAARERARGKDSSDVLPTMKVVRHCEPLTTGWPREWVDVKNRFQRTSGRNDRKPSRIPRTDATD